MCVSNSILALLPLLLHKHILYHNVMVRCSLLVFDPLDCVDPYKSVRDLIVFIVSTSDAVVQWNHTDECEMTDHYKVNSSGLHWGVYNK